MQPKPTITANRSISPLRNSSSKPKYYSAQQVNKIVRNSFQPKIQYFMQQLEQRQLTIAALNNKLNENDEKLLQQSSIIQGYIKKQKELPHMQTFVVNTINQVITERSKNFSEAVSQKIKEIGAKVQEKFDQKRLEGVIQGEMEKLKQAVAQFMDFNKSKNNAYWQKIKDALNKINAKIMKNQKDILDISLKLQNLQVERQKDRETAMQLHNGKNVVRNLIELKKSVGNIYGNYQTILSLQKGLKQRLEEEQSGNEIWQDVYYDPRGNFNDQILLDYSREEGIGTKKQGEGPKAENILSMVSPIKGNPNKSLTADLFKATTPNGKSSEFSELFSMDVSQNQANSRFQNNTLLINVSLQTRKEMCLGVKQRLLELMSAKKWQQPLEVRYDQQINYLKSVEGNYLFDLKGNMFKTTLPDLLKLQEQGIVIRSKKKDSSNSRVKLIQI